MNSSKKQITTIILALAFSFSLFGCTMNPPAGIGEGGDTIGNANAPAIEPTLDEDLGSVQQEAISTPTLEPTPEPTPELTPEPTPEMTPTPSPSPTPMPAPMVPPVITKQPTDETVYVGGTAYFIAKADGAEELSWYIAGPDGTTGYSAKEISAYLPAVSCSGYDAEMLTISNVTADMDGWKVVCRFTNSAGKTYSTAAVIHVDSKTLPQEVLAEFNTTDSIKIKIHPKSDKTYTGENLTFLSDAENYTSVEWYLISQDGSKKVLVGSDECKTLFPDVWTAIAYGNMSYIDFVNSSLNNWYIVAVFENANGKKASDPAYLYIEDGKAPERRQLTPNDFTEISLPTEEKQKMIDLLEIIKNTKQPGEAGCSYSWAYTTFRVADFFVESGISSEDAGKMAAKYFESLSAQDRGLYRLKSRIICDNTGSLSDEQYINSFYNDYKTMYSPSYYPWNQRDLTDCFAALVIDW